MRVRAKESCYVERQYHEAGEVFEWHNAKKEPLPACMEAVEPETPDAEPEEPAERRRPGRPRKQG